MHGEARGIVRAARLREERFIGMAAVTDCESGRPEEEIVIRAAIAVRSSVLGLQEDVCEHLAADLDQSLANLTDLAAMYKQAHWNVAGPNFAQLHELFDRFADQTREYMDMVAERAVTLGGTARGTIQAAAESSSLTPFPQTERSQWPLVEELVLRLEQVASDLRQAMDASADEADTEDVLIDGSARR